MKPITWEDITIKQFTDIMAVSEKYKGEVFDQTKYAIDILSVITGRSPDYFMELPINELLEWTKTIGFLNNQPKSRLDHTIQVEGIVYKVPINVMEVSTAQYIDYMETLKNDAENIAMMCAIFCVPVGKKYNEGYEVMHLREVFYNRFKIVDAMGISFFFTKLLEAYAKTTLTFLTKKLKQAKKTANKEEIKEIKKSIKLLQQAGGLISS